jgi:sortase A
MLLGGAAIAVYAGATGYSNLYQAQASRTFDRLLLEEKVSTARPAAGTFSAGDGLLGRIRIPSIGMNVMVVEGTDRAALLRGVGHIEGTAPLGWTAGNVGVAGHRDSYFRGLQRITKNDSIFVDTPQGSHEYRVEEIRIVGPKDTGVLTESSEGVLTLVTCYPFGYVGPAPRRFVVRASLRPDPA